MVRRVIPMTRRHGIRPVVFFILGFPGRMPGDRRDARADAGPLAQVVFKPAIASILIPFPGTEIYDRYKDEHGFAGGG